jgi:hypothetical protein
MRKTTNLSLGYCIGSCGAMNLSSQLSLATILEAKQGDVNHGTIRHQYRHVRRMGRARRGSIYYHQCM